MNKVTHFPARTASRPLTLLLNLSTTGKAALVADLGKKNVSQRNSKVY